MKVVVDTNKIFSALISNQSKIRDFLLESDFEFYSPNFVFIELFKHKERMLRLCKLTENEFYIFLNGLLNKIHFINTDFISLKNKQLAYELCCDIDQKDTPFVALTLDRLCGNSCVFWSIFSIFSEKRKNNYQIDRDLNYVPWESDLYMAIRNKNSSVFA